MWRVTYDTWHMTWYTWHIKCKMWHLAHDLWWTLCQNFGSLVLMVWELCCFEDFEEEDRWMNTTEPYLHSYLWRVCYQRVLSRLRLAERAEFSPPPPPPYPTTWSCDFRANERPEKNCMQWRRQTNRQSRFSEKQGFIFPT